jgi:hypothetical protein
VAVPVGMAVAVVIEIGGMTVAVPAVVVMFVTGCGAVIVAVLAHFTTILPVRTTRRSPPASLVGSLTLRCSDSIDGVARDCEHLNEASLLSLSVLE